MSKMRNIGIIGFGATFVCGALYLFLDSKNETELKSNAPEVKNTVQETHPAENIPAKNEAPSLQSTENVPKKSGEVINKSVWKLDSSNFEFRVSKCFQGEACELDEDPLTLYRLFKKSGNNKAVDLLISYLRKNLKEPRFAELYKSTLKKMIDDFYPPQEKQFQEAAYYNYLGDLDKSLKLYLDLEKKAAVDPSLRKAPKLNIANTYYDLGKFREALPYYEVALQRHLKPEARGPEQDDVVRFIERRIEEIKTKLN